MAPDFRSPAFLLDHVAATMRFYRFFRADGTSAAARASSTTTQRRSAASAIRSISRPCAAASPSCAARTATRTWAAADGRSRGTQPSDETSPAGKTDYHTMGACHDVLRALEAAR